MAAINDILAAKDEALTIFDQKIAQAQYLQGPGAPGMDLVVARLKEYRLSLARQDFSAEFAPTAAQVLAAVKAATVRLHSVAAQMNSVAELVAKINEFLSAASYVQSALASSLSGNGTASSLPGDGTMRPIKRPK